jgi:hypothetical protein
MSDRHLICQPVVPLAVFACRLHGRCGWWRTVTKDWTEHYLVDLAAGSVRHARSAEYERSQVKHERFLAQAVAASGCSPKS